MSRFRLFGAGGVWQVVKSWVQGRNVVAREREDRATAETVMRHLKDEGGIWVDRDGLRLRVVIRPTGNGRELWSQLEQAERLLVLEPQADDVGTVSLDPDVEQGSAPDTR